MAIKAAAKRPWSDDGEDRFATTWYEPYDDAAGVARGVSFTLSVPGVHGICTPGDLSVLRMALDAAERLEPMEQSQRDEAIEQASALPSIFPIPA
jgi:hypothetical protein